MRNPDSSKKVFILGAGASKGSDFHLPTMDGFFDDKSLSTEEFKQLKEFLCKYSGENGPTKVNLEDVMSYLEIYASEFSFLGASPDGQEMINNIRGIQGVLKRYIIKRLSHGNDDYYLNPSKLCMKHKALFDTLKSEDTVITLNYDMIADYALVESDYKKILGTPSYSRFEKLNYLVKDGTYMGGPPSSVGGYRDSPGYYLKLHGSINWVHCPYPRCRKYDYIEFPVFWIKSGESKFEPQPGQQCFHCGVTLETLIIPPTFTKKIDAILKLQLLWNLARQEISQATEIILYGVSLAPSDFLLRWLLKHATVSVKDIGDSAKVIVINPCSEHQERAKEVMAVNIYPYNTIEEYLNSSNKALK